MADVREPSSERTAEIWAIAGGKGGTGKTFITSQLAVVLAERNKKVVIVDADIGGANVHTFFGLKRDVASLHQFFENKCTLNELITPTYLQNLSVIKGDSYSINTESVKHFQKLKLLRDIRHIDADYVLIDLGAGSNFNTIDLFLLADKMVVVTVPEITAIENLFQFIKNSYFRKLNSIMSLYGLKNRVKTIWKDRSKHNITGIVDLVEYIKREYHVNSAVIQELAEFSINIILNKVRNSMEIQEGFSIRSLCIKFLGVQSLFSGYIEYDHLLWKNLSLMQTKTKFNVSPRIQNEIIRATDNIITRSQMKIGNIKHG